MQRGQGRQHFVEEPEHLLEVGTGAEVLLHAASVGVGHHDEGLVVAGLAAVVDGDQVGVADASGHGHFPSEAGPEAAMHGQVASHHLDRDVDAQQTIPSAVDRACGAFADQRLDAVARGKLGQGWVGHQSTGA